MASSAVTWVIGAWIMDSTRVGRSKTWAVSDVPAGFCAWLSAEERADALGSSSGESAAREDTAGTFEAFSASRS